MRPWFSAFVFLMSVTLTAFADPPSQENRSRENQTFEAQSGVSSQAIGDWFARHHILADGIVSTGYNLVVRPGDLSVNTTGLPNPESHNMVLQVESRVFAYCPFVDDTAGRALGRNGTCSTTVESRDTNGTVGQLFPFEISMSLQMNDGMRADVRNIRAGIWRLIIKTLGITLQFGNYTFENYRHQLGVRHGFSPASIVVNEVLRIDHNGRIAVVLRGFFEGDVGTTIGHLPALDAVRAASGWQGNGSAVRWGLRAQGSVGLRFFDRLLLEFMGGVYVQDHGHQRQANETVNASGDHLYTQRFGGDNITQSFIGGGLRFRFNDRLALTASLIQNTYSMDASYNRGGTITPARYYESGYNPATRTNPNTVTDPSLRQRNQPNSIFNASSYGTTTVQDLSGYIGLELRY